MSDTFCILPWIHLATHPNGTATLCCQVDTINKLGFAKNEQILDLNTNQNVEEFMNSDEYKKTRLQMLNGEQPKACAKCFEHEAAGSKSKRIYDTYELHPDFGFEEAKRLTAEDGSIDVAKTLSYVELRLGNLCNVKCKTCNPASSSSWYSDYKKLEAKVKWVPSYRDITNADRKTMFSWCENWAFYESLLKYAGNLKELYINGGEPTLIDLHGKFLDQLIELDYAKNITLSYSINMTTPCDKYIERWKNFKQVIIKASIDDVGEKNQYIRTGTKWDAVIRNLDAIVETNFKIEIMQTISAFNLDTLIDLSHFMNQRYGYERICMAYNFAKYPEFISIDAIDPEVVENLKTQIAESTVLSDYQKFDLSSKLKIYDFNPSLKAKFQEYKSALDEIQS